MQKVLIIDTSILCVWLRVAGKETCGQTNEQWEKSRVDKLLKEEVEAGTTLVLPLSTIIETGNHITQANSRQYETAQELARIMALAADERSPWAAFENQAILWNAAGLKQLAEEWANLVSQKISIGDVAVKMVADFYARSGFKVEILTGDAGLKAYEPVKPVELPKRRSQRRSQ